MSEIDNTVGQWGDGSVLPATPPDPPGSWPAQRAITLDDPPIPALEGPSRGVPSIQREQQEMNQKVLRAASERNTVSRGVTGGFISPGEVEALPGSWQAKVTRSYNRLRVFDALLQTYAQAVNNDDWEAAAEIQQTLCRMAWDLPKVFSALPLDNSTPPA